MIPTIAVFGVTGRTGLAVAAEAGRRGWPVRAIVRPGGSEPAPAIVVVRGTYDDAAALSVSLAGADAALVVFGPRPGTHSVFCAAATQAVIAAMTKSGCRRLVCQTGAMLGLPAGNRSLAMDFMARMFARSQTEIARDRAEQEAVVQGSGLDWTIVKPPRLGEGPARGTVRAGVDMAIGMTDSIQRADLAAFLLDEIATPRYLRQRVFVRN